LTVIRAATGWRAAHTQDFACPTKYCAGFDSAGLAAAVAWGIADGIG
jgi:hypothetical protein